ncbi:glycosyltransferase family 2 protein [Thaumasiovibrio subtropicus]|uniref:glycosyltransferase family 2 protein n=1 Tax=Thaumasiovibrio subtropicus TaxID=1891207 RepID=UPI001FE9E9F0|nr:glycosyltransferase family 2 protein [Thaumasiovibrio subtropicus]
MDNMSLMISVLFLFELVGNAGLLLVFLFKKTTSSYDEKLPSSTVFIPYYNEDPELLVRSLNSINNQIKVEKLQVLVINDGSTNDSPKIVDEWLLSTDLNHDFELINIEKNGGRKGFALDHALSLDVARGDIYIVVDSDTCIDEMGVFYLAEKIASDDKYAAVCGYIVPDNSSESILVKSQYYEHAGVYRALRSAQDKMGMVPVLAGAFVAHRADVVKQLGGWSAWLVEDISWCWKALANNYKTGYASKATARTQCPDDSRSLFRQRRRWARGRVEAFFETWKVSTQSGFASLPVFMFTTIQYFTPPILITFPLLIIFNMWLPLAIYTATIF